MRMDEPMAIAGKLLLTINRIKPKVEFMYEPRSNKNKVIAIWELDDHDIYDFEKIIAKEDGDFDLSVIPVREVIKLLEKLAKDCEDYGKPEDAYHYRSVIPFLESYEENKIKEMLI